LKRGFAEGRSANKGKLGKKDSPETREKKRLAALNRKPHSQETKDKIGKAHKGKIMPREAVEKQQASYLEAIERNGGGFATGPRSQEMRDRMSEIAKNRPESEWRPKMEAAWEARRGVKLSPEQCEKHRQATLKWMQENPTRVFNTKVELAFRSELDSRGIAYVQQFRIENHPYDFFLSDYNTIVEIDGPHHWKGPIWGVSGKTQEEKDQIFERQLNKDARENMIAGLYGYRIVRLPVGSKLDNGPYGPFLEVLKSQGLELKEKE
jgi:very-short-patch-repair endonuclease